MTTKKCRIYAALGVSQTPNYKGKRKERYFTHDLKQEHIKVDKETGEKIIVPSREDSYERLLEAEKQFAGDAEDVEDAAVRAVML